MNASAAKAVGNLLRRPELVRLLAVLNGDGEETRIVGGAVRNSLLGRPVDEVDLATTALPEVVSARARKAGFKPVPTGIEHGTVTVVVAGTPFEVTTLREDVETFGRHAKVRFGRDFAHDARRRDFTMNALFLDRDGVLHDCVGGLADLEAGRVRFIGDATTRIREDYLRILRFFRFQAEYGRGPLDRQGFDAAVAERAGLAGLSRERIRAELLKLVAAPRAAEVVRDISDAGLLALLIGGVTEAGRLARAAWAEKPGAPDAIRRLEALAVLTVEDAERLRTALRLSNAEHERLSGYARALAALRSRDAPLGEAEIRRAVVLHGNGAVADALAATAGETRPAFTEEGRRTAQRFRSGAEPTPSFPLRGADLLARGLAPGEDIGRRLAAARARWLDEGCPEGDGAKQRLIEAALAGTA